MLRQLLLVLALVAGVIAFTGCERDGVNGTTDRDGVETQQDDTLNDATAPDQTQDGTTADEFGVQRGTQDTTQNGADANAM